MVCANLPFYCFDKTLTKTTSEEGLFGLHVYFTLYVKVKPSKNLSKAETWRQKLKQKPWREAAYCWDHGGMLLSAEEKLRNIVFCLEHRGTVFTRDTMEEQGSLWDHGGKLLTAEAMEEHWLQMILWGNSAYCWDHGRTLLFGEIMEEHCLGQRPQRDTF